MTSIYIVLYKNYMQYTHLWDIALNFVNDTLCILGNIIRYIRYTLYKLANSEQEVK